MTVPYVSYSLDMISGIVPTKRPVESSMTSARTLLSSAWLICWKMVCSMMLQLLKAIIWSLYAWRSALITAAVPSVVGKVGRDGQTKGVPGAMQA